MAAEHYIVKGAGWEVRVAPLGTCVVLQGTPDAPQAADEVSCVNPGRFSVRCLGCGTALVVRKHVAPVCRECRWNP